MVLLGIWIVSYIQSYYEIRFLNPQVRVITKSNHSLRVITDKVQSNNSERGGAFFSPSLKYILAATGILIDSLKIKKKSQMKRKLQLITLKFQLISQIVINFQRHRDSAAYLRERKRQLGLGKLVAHTGVGGNPTRNEIIDELGNLPRGLSPSPQPWHASIFNPTDHLLKPSLVSLWNSLDPLWNHICSVCLPSLHLSLATICQNPPLGFLCVWALLFPSRKLLSEPGLGMCWFRIGDASHFWDLRSTSTHKDWLMDQVSFSKGKSTPFRKYTWLRIG